MQIICANCGDVCEVPKEILIGLDSVDQIEPYICDACESARDEAADDLDHEDGLDGWLLHTNDHGDTVDETGRIVNEDGTEPHPVKTCQFCGAELIWIDCWMCGGEGEYDETETDPLEGDQFATCPECYGKGGYLECPDLPHSDATEQRLAPDPASCVNQA